MSEAINLTVSSSDEVIRLTITEQDPVYVNFYNIAIPDTRVTQAVIDAEAAAAAAATSEANAAGSENNASTSATNAATSETNAATSATNAATSATNASTSETSAASSASAASTSATNAATSETNAATSATNASNSASAAATSETNAASSASSAETSRLAAEAAANATMWQDVIFVSSGDSPLTLDNTYSGVMLSCDCSGGAIVINLPEIATLDLALPWALGIKKSDSSGNSVTINRAATDTIDGATSKVLASSSSGATFIPDTGPVPDTWTTAEFGASAGNMTVNTFAGDGSTVAFTLTVDPGSENNIQVFVGGVYQEKGTFTLSGTTLTLDEAPASGVNVEVVSGTTLSVGTPSDGTVTQAKLASDVVSLIDGKATSTAWAAYTPTYTGFGTVSDQLQWRRVGDSIEIRGKFTSGTPSATEARVSLPNSYSVAGTSSVPSIQHAGTWVFSTASALAGYTLIEPSVGYITFGYQNGTHSGLTKQNADQFMISGRQLSINATVPINGLSV